MKLQDWYTSNLDDVQRQIVMIDLENTFVVQGSAGSGKTILALHRAAQANMFGTFTIIVYTKALKAMIEYGLKVLGLPMDRAVYEWSWDNRGIELNGDVYCELDLNKPILNDKKEIIDYYPNSNVLYLKNGNNIDIFRACSQDRKTYYAKLYDEILQNIKTLKTTERNLREQELSKYVTIDYADFVPNKIYYTFYRRERWFEKVDTVTNINLADNKKYELIASAGLYRKKIPVDYMIVDEAQDFSLSDIGKFKNDTLKSMVLFGDSVQQVYADRGVSLDRAVSEMNIKRYFLTYNYRLPKTVAKVAEIVSNPPQNLVQFSKRNNGKSDFPDFPKPFIKKCASRDEQIDFVIQQMKKDNLDDIGILLPNQNDVQYVWDYLQKKGIDTQVRFNKYFEFGTFQMFRQVDTLDFTNPDLPSILTFHSSKGTQFENVFILFAENGIDRNPFYVALTRTSRRIFITYQSRLTSLLDELPKEYFTIL